MGSDVELTSQGHFPVVIQGHWRKMFVWEFVAKQIPEFFSLEQEQQTDFHLADDSPLIGGGCLKHCLRRTMRKRTIFDGVHIGSRNTDCNTTYLTGFIRRPKYLFHTLRHGLAMLPRLVSNSY
jgi:hypothetical protein